MTYPSKISISRTELNLQQQRGATLIVALSILTIITLLGVSTMQNATLQERMANNSRQKTIANNAAESALREAEQRLSANIDNETKLQRYFSDGAAAAELGNGVYSDVAIARLNIARSRAIETIGDLEEDQNWIDNPDAATEIVDLSSDWAFPPRFVIEYLGQTRGNPDEGGTNSSVQNMDVGHNADTNNPHVFRITSIGWSKNPDIYSVLQTTFFTGDADYVN